MKGRKGGRQGRKEGRKEAGGGREGWKERGSRGQKEGGREGQKEGDADGRKEVGTKAREGRKWKGNEPLFSVQCAPESRNSVPAPSPRRVVDWVALTPAGVAAGTLRSGSSCAGILAAHTRTGLSFYHLTRTSYEMNARTYHMTNCMGRPYRDKEQKAV